MRSPRAARTVATRDDHAVAMACGLHRWLAMTRTPRSLQHPDRALPWFVGAALALEIGATTVDPVIAVVLLPVLTQALRIALRARTHSADDHDPHGDTLERIVAEHAPALPVLAEQLRDTAVQVEQSVVTVCTSFQGMASRARAVVDDLNARLGDHEETAAGAQPSMTGLIDTARERLDNALLQIIQGNAASASVLSSMAEAQLRLRDIAAAVDRVEALSSKTSLLALNARMEAVRAGEHGARFSTVADDVKRLAEQVGETSREVRTLVASTAASFTEARDGLQELTEGTDNAAEFTRGEVESAMTTLARTNEGLQQAMYDALEGSRRLAGEISRAVVGLQFQDAVNQRLHHVIDALTQAQLAMAAQLPASSGQSDSRWVEELKRAYSMAAEREILARHHPDATMDGADTPSSAGGSVELF